ncbi:hypothetical protein ACFQFC_17275 [Amorphoplanes digitatis]|uniref:Uncharacterized protein n=1 Tax=Actinoplanes digitatis TaxID=1868 RepID=A0A7W7MT33_9ACTN|nr:hypothetical protein [Actinoplanes digitatis]MBB4765966.1 hypothetical protein [Actinoplanes digitatis]BFE75931.1 hypothetical protein GCM10020092_092320 [Actinoplanes digitatis]GID97276.1 hypothetical protein Adi01nite_66880 [Actinoplanes digitatis]
MAAGHNTPQRLADKAAGRSWDEPTCTQMPSYRAAQEKNPLATAMSADLSG